jgi:hypothetical protein
MSLSIGGNDPNLVYCLRDPYRVPTRFPFGKTPDV